MNFPFDPLWRDRNIYFDRKSFKTFKTVLSLLRTKDYMSLLMLKGSNLVQKLNSPTHIRWNVAEKVNNHQNWWNYIQRCRFERYLFNKTSFFENFFGRMNPLKSKIPKQAQKRENKNLSEMKKGCIFKLYWKKWPYTWK